MKLHSRIGGSGCGLSAQSGEDRYVIVPGRACLQTASDLVSPEHGSLMRACRYILGSRSPRRLELLRLLVPAHQIDVIPPATSEEPGFDGLVCWPDIKTRLQAITCQKSQDVWRQLASDQRENAVVITADTSVIVDGLGRCLSATTFLQNSPLLVLGQPPHDDTWRSTVREWFQRWYAGRTHVVATAVQVTGPDGWVAERVCTTAVTFRPDVDRWLDWYLTTDEPLGKAGGYALQGAASIFVERVEGSLSNVVGLPLETLLELLPLDRVQPLPIEA